MAKKARDLTDLERRCLDLARANRVAEKLPRRPYRITYHDERLRLQWEPGSPSWCNWGRAIAALGCAEDRHVWKVGKQASYKRWRKVVIDQAAANGADAKLLRAMDAVQLALAVMARSPILGSEPRREIFLPISPPFATWAEAIRAEAGLNAMGVRTSLDDTLLIHRPNGGEFYNLDLYAWEVLASEFRYRKQLREPSGNDHGRDRNWKRNDEVFNLAEVDEAEFRAAANAVRRAFKGLIDRRMAVGYLKPPIPAMALTEAGMAEVETPGAGLVMEPASVTMPLFPSPTPMPELRFADPPIPRPGSDLGRLAVLSGAMVLGYTYDERLTRTEFPNNLISRWAVVDEAGGIGRLAAPAEPFDPDEAVLSRVLAGEAAGIMAGTEVGMYSSSWDYFSPFSIAARIGHSPPRRIDAELIRARFGGTIFPLAVVLVEPVAEAGSWWGEATYHGAIDEPERLAPWQAMVRWFRDHPAFIDSAFVSIGDSSLDRLPRDALPLEASYPGVIWPRLALGLTRAGQFGGNLRRNRPCIVGAGDARFSVCLRISGESS